VGKKGGKSRAGLKQRSNLDAFKEGKKVMDIQ
jgi:hypothetical protein